MDPAAQAVATDTSLRMAHYTFWLVLIAAVQATLFVWQLWLIRGTLKMTAAATEATKKSAEATHRAYINTVRPKIVIRQIDFVDATDGAEVSFTLANIGGSAATVTEVNATPHILIKGNALPAVPPYKDHFSRKMVVAIGPGERERIHYKETLSDMTMTLTVIVQFSADLLLVGYVKYKDSNGVQHEMAFARRRNADSNRFEVVGDADYEYSD